MKHTHLLLGTFIFSAVLTVGCSPAVDNSCPSEATALIDAHISDLEAAVLLAEGEQNPEEPYCLYDTQEGAAVVAFSYTNNTVNPAVDTRVGITVKHESAINRLYVASYTTDITEPEASTYIDYEKLVFLSNTIPPYVQGQAQTCLSYFSDAVVESSVDCDLGL